MSQLATAPVLCLVLPDSSFAVHAWLNARGLNMLFGHQRVLVVSDLQRQVLRSLKISGDVSAAAVLLAPGLEECGRSAFTSEGEALQWLDERCQPAPEH